MTPDLTAKLKEWKNTMSNPKSLHTAFQHRLPCKWIRPLRDVFVACWNKEKVMQHIDNDVGIVTIADREYCRGEVDDMPDCWEGLRQSCIDKCIHYFKYEKPSKYDKLKGFCTKQCKTFEKFAQEIKFERTKMIDFEPIKIQQKDKKQRQRITELIL